jgi:hypothetical protein
MSHFDAQKTTIIDEFRTHPTDTGSPEVQIALLTRRIHSRFKKRTFTPVVACCDWSVGAAVSSTISRRRTSPAIASSWNSWGSEAEAEHYQAHALPTLPQPPSRVGTDSGGVRLKIGIPDERDNKVRRD